jgi:hypothetical protein
MKLTVICRRSEAKSIRDAAGIETLQWHLRGLTDYLEANQAMLSWQS